MPKKKEKESINKAYKHKINSASQHKHRKKRKDVRHKEIDINMKSSQIVPCLLLAINVECVSPSCLIRHDWGLPKVALHVIASASPHLIGSLK
jgi:hypothetical protein